MISQCFQRSSMCLLKIPTHQILHGVQHIQVEPWSTIPDTLIVFYVKLVGRFIMIKHNFRKKKLDRAKERSIFLILPIETTEEYQSQIPNNTNLLDFVLLLRPKLILLKFWSFKINNLLPKTVRCVSNIRLMFRIKLKLFIKIRVCVQCSLLVLSGFKQIDFLLFPLKSLKSQQIFIISGVIEVYCFA